MTKTNSNNSSFSPREIVSELDRYITGQLEAKRAVAIALRNRWRRQQLSDEMKEEVLPKNILMIGPTGIGKTEISRRLAKLAQAPFVKVEATKFTEVGYVGRDVEQIVRDLLEIAISMTKEKKRKEVEAKAKIYAEERVLDALCGKGASPTTKDSFRTKLRKGNLDDKEIEIKNDVVDYMKNNKNVLESALNYMIAVYLEGINASPNVATKLRETIPRTTLKKSVFEEIKQLQGGKCFFCSRQFDMYAQEHFLPWNFIFRTENFNITAACKTCNGSKNDRLPETKYLEKIIQRNKKLSDLSSGYSEEFFRQLYETCRIEYHGKDSALWKGTA